MASVKLANYKARVEYLHKLHTAKVAEYNELLNARIAEYESHWFRKLFGWKFKDSCEWQWDWYCNSSTTVHYCEKELQRIEYHEKLGDERIEFNEDYFGLYNFYDWAKMNIDAPMGWKPDNSEKFWWLLGLDQFLHAITYIGLVALVTN